MSIEAVVFGATGYVGGELLRLVAEHPDMTLGAAVSSSQAGKPVTSVFSHLHGQYGDHQFTAVGSWAATTGDRIALFSAAPHGASAPLLRDALAAADRDGKDIRVVDVSADFRYRNGDAFADVYGIPHGADELLSDFACSVPEHAQNVPRHVGHPGCFATAMLLAAVPVLQRRLVKPELFISAITGSTGSGRTAAAGTHHPERHSNLYAYKPLAHRHVPEVEGLIYAATGEQAQVRFIPHSGPFARGIYATLQATLHSPLALADLQQVYRDSYAASPFVVVTDGLPRLKNVVSSNYAHIGIAVNDNQLAIFCAIDNLVKGAAGGAMQWMNRLWALPEERGLTAAAPAWT